MAEGLRAGAAPMPRTFPAMPLTSIRRRAAGREAPLDFALSSSIGCSAGGTGERHFWALIAAPPCRRARHGFTFLRRPEAEFRFHTSACRHYTTVLR